MSVVLIDEPHPINYSISSTAAKRSLKVIFQDGLSLKSWKITFKRLKPLPLFLHIEILHLPIS